MSFLLSTHVIPMLRPRDKPIPILFIYSRGQMLNTISLLLFTTVVISIPRFMVVPIPNSPHTLHTDFSINSSAFNSFHQRSLKPQPPTPPPFASHMSSWWSLSVGRSPLCTSIHKLIPRFCRCGERKSFSIDGAGISLKSVLQIAMRDSGAFCRGKSWKSCGNIKWDSGKDKRIVG